jgi:hypothetical protein
MATTIATIRAMVRKDLRDDDSVRWTDDELDRHIQHAVTDISCAVPLQARDTDLTIPDPASREIDISGITGRISVEAVEYPVGYYPRRYRHFTLWADILELLIDTEPAAGDSVYLYYGKLHTVDVDGSTLPASLEDLCAVGAGAYAALEWAAYAINQVNVGGDPTPENFLEWGQARLEYFLAELKRLKSAKLKARTLYAEDTT